MRWTMKCHDKTSWDPISAPGLALECFRYLGSPKKYWTMFGGPKFQVYFLHLFTLIYK
jgi:hypothetical protein